MDPESVDEATWEEEREKLRADLGQRMKTLRQDCGLTLEGAALRTGLALSTIHKIENGRVSPSYENLVRVARGYGVGIERLLSAEAGSDTAKTRMTVTRAGTGSKERTSSYEYEVLCSALSEKKIIPLVAIIDRRGKLHSKDLGAHEGEECIYVLSGRVELQVEHYAPVELGVGDCAYYDSTLKHAIRALDDTETRIFWISTDLAFAR